MALALVLLGVVALLGATPAEGQLVCGNDPAIAAGGACTDGVGKTPTYADPCAKTLYHITGDLEMLKTPECRRNSDSAAGEGVCRVPNGYGEWCFAHEDCWTGLQCSGGMCAELAVGALTTPGCDDTNNFDADTCLPMLSSGDACISSSQCFCWGGVCADWVGVGDACDADHLYKPSSATKHCSVGRCVDGTCAAAAAEGAPCLGHADCESGNCDLETLHANNDFYTAATVVGTCAAAAAGNGDGTAVNCGDAPCAEGEYCTNWVIAAFPTEAVCSFEVPECTEPAECTLDTECCDGKSCLPTWTDGVQDTAMTCQFLPEGAMCSSLGGRSCASDLTCISGTCTSDNSNIQAGDLAGGEGWCAAMGHLGTSQPAHCGDTQTLLCKTNGGQDGDGNPADAWVAAGTVAAGGDAVSMFDCGPGLWYDTAGTCEETGVACSSASTCGHFQASGAYCDCDGAGAAGTCMNDNTCTDSDAFVGAMYDYVCEDTPANQKAMYEVAATCYGVTMQWGSKTLDLDEPEEDNNNAGNDPDNNNTSNNNAGNNVDPDNNAPGDGEAAGEGAGDEDSGATKSVVYSLTTVAFTVVAALMATLF